MNIDRMNLENTTDSDFQPEINRHYSKAISCIIAWLPALSFDQLMEMLISIQYKAEERLDVTGIHEYLAYQREVEKGDLTAPAFLQTMIENSIKKSLSQINDLEAANSGLDALVDELKKDIEILNKVLDQYREEVAIQQKTMDKLIIQTATCLQILEIFSDKNGSHLTHSQRDAYAAVGRGVFDKLFPEGLPFTAKSLSTHYEEF